MGGGDKSTAGASSLLSGDLLQILVSLPSVPDLCVSLAKDLRFIQDAVFYLEALLDEGDAFVSSYSRGVFLVSVPLDSLAVLQFCHIIKNITGYRQRSM